MISTNVPAAKTATPKTLQPGNTKITIRKIFLEEFPYSKAEGISYNLKLECVGEDLGESFVGFFIDKDKESLGRHKGQVGTIRATQWAFEDKIIAARDINISRDVEIVKFLTNLAAATGCQAWMKENDGVFGTIEEFVNAFNAEAPYKEVVLDVCLSGKEYENKGGYTNHDLFFPKFSKEGIPFADPESDQAARVLVFDATKHVIAKKPAKVVESFGTEEGEGLDFAEEEELEL